MIVMKFGGTSVGSAKSILNVKKIVESAQKPIIVVVSALGGITDKLIQTSKMAAQGDPAFQESFDEIIARHREMIAQVIPVGVERNTLSRQVEVLLNELNGIFHARLCF